MGRGGVVNVKVNAINGRGQAEGGREFVNVNVKVNGDFGGG